MSSMTGSSWVIRTLFSGWAISTTSGSDPYSAECCHFSFLPDSYMNLLAIPGVKQSVNSLNENWHWRKIAVLRCPDTGYRSLSAQHVVPQQCSTLMSSDCSVTLTSVSSWWLWTPGASSSWCTFQFQWICRSSMCTLWCFITVVTCDAFSSSIVHHSSHQNSKPSIKSIKTRTFNIWLWLI